MITQIQRIITNQINAMALCDAVIGTVESIKPLRVALPSGIVLTRDELYLCAAILPREYNPNHVHRVQVGELWYESATCIPTLEDITLEGIVENDTVLLMRFRGGQKYAMISKLV